jgi:DNA-binding MarR family transcriptional regulator
MKTKTILIELIERLEEFEGTVGEGSLTMADFVSFLTRKMSTPSVETRQDSGDEAPWLTDMGNETDTVIARMVTVMNRYAKSYIKRALEISPIQTAEEFSFMLYLVTNQSLTKSELIFKNIMEKTSGMEVIKRLLKLGLVEEHEDENDKRSKRLSLTATGRHEIFKVLPTMQKVSSLVAGNLTKQERQTLAQLLAKLDHYHHSIYLSDKQSDFEELSHKYLGGSLN